MQVETIRDAVAIAGASGQAALLFGAALLMVCCLLWAAVRLQRVPR